MFELDVDDIGPSLRFAPVEVTKVERTTRTDIIESNPLAPGPVWGLPSTGLRLLWTVVAVLAPLYHG